MFPLPFKDNVPVGWPEDVRVNLLEVLLVHSGLMIKLGVGGVITVGVQLQCILPGLSCTLDGESPLFTGPGGTTDQRLVQLSLTHAVPVLTTISGGYNRTPRQVQSRAHQRQNG